MLLNSTWHQPNEGRLVIKTIVRPLQRGRLCSNHVSTSVVEIQLHICTFCVKRVVQLQYAILVLFNVICVSSTRFILKYCEARLVKHLQRWDWGWRMNLLTTCTRGNTLPGPELINFLLFRRMDHLTRETWRNLGQFFQHHFALKRSCPMVARRETILVCTTFWSDLWVGLHPLERVRQHKPLDPYSTFWILVFWQ